MTEPATDAQVELCRRNATSDPCWPHYEPADEILALIARIDAERAHAASLRAALETLFELCQHGDFQNGVTDPSGAIDEGEVLASGCMDQAQAALSAAPSAALAAVRGYQAELKEAAQHAKDGHPGCAAVLIDQVQKHMAEHFGAPPEEPPHG